MERREREVILESELEKEEHRLVNDVRGKEEQLAKAHQDVIAQMREAMLEARGAPRLGPGGRGRGGNLLLYRHLILKLSWLDHERD